MRILLVEDERPLREAIATVLKEEAYGVDEAEDGHEGLYLAEQRIHDLIVLDIMLPGMDGLAVLDALREKGIETPVLLLTAMDSVEDRVRGLDTGADDYMVKPFAMRELLARLRVLLRRRSQGTRDGELQYGRLTVRSPYMEGYANGEGLKLTAKEFELMEFLLLNREQILTKEQLLDRVWGIDSDASLGVVDVYVHYLRRKLAPSGCDGYIHTIRGVGYMLKERA
ncbi:DNA-binding response OmpR family regulator [Paenibacillus cellulosilyticus]|uniref:DNA-binding response OmpR family regulator n=1 Tax=Paenibacillus cellulosilyticus TaxID=375489 RepID=A0A2V2YQE3_9BACL|nr:response regulator transcription factor [Paenibacillus cellulosilyticus]PWV98687.1 DNA-binding response OmpR family regulator [Paenibacillus cellulosilyticus]QKS43810.1 response regulator transcription factor [Paenibacillus cellulosilyticus]